MNPLDTLKLVLDHQAALRREARIHALARSARHRHHSGFGREAVAGPEGMQTDPLGVRRFLDQ
jgi:hypothetical protein